MPVNPKAKLVENILDLKTLEQKLTRDGFGLGLVEAVEKLKYGVYNQIMLKYPYE